MPDFYLIGDESIVLTSQNVVLEKEQYEAILTNRRLILIRSGGEKLPSREILLRDVGSAISGESGSGAPTITLTFTSPDGVLHAQELIFPKLSPGQDNIYYSEWVKKIKEKIKQAAQEPAPAPVSMPIAENEQNLPLNGDIRKVNAALADGEISPANEEGALSPHNEPSKPEDPLLNASADIPSPEPGAPKIPEPAAHKNVRSIVIVIILIVIAATIIGGAYYYTHYISQPSTGPAPFTATVIATPLPAETSISQPSLATTEPVVTASVTGTSVPDTSGGEMIIPKNGIWVRIQYKGNFSGSVGIQGSMRDVTGTGDNFFQIAAIKGIIDASVQKLDDTGKSLVVTIYNNGTAIKQGTTTAPHGTLTLNAWID